VKKLRDFAGGGMRPALIWRGLERRSDTSGRNGRSLMARRLSQFKDRAQAARPGDEGGVRGASNEVFG
jgi:hypothetical protein